MGSWWVANSLICHMSDLNVRGTMYRALHFF